MKKILCVAIMTTPLVSIFSQDAFQWETLNGKIVELVRVLAKCRQENDAVEANVCSSEKNDLQNAVMEHAYVSVKAFASQLEGVSPKIHDEVDEKIFKTRPSSVSELRHQAHSDKHTVLLLRYLNCRRTGNHGLCQRNLSEFAQEYSKYFADSL